MTNHLPDRLAAELAVCDKATDGPWGFLKERVVTMDMDMVTPRLHSVSDAEFIATARTALPTALRALQAVMGLEDESISGTMMGCEIDQANGYNEALRDVREAIQEVYGDADSS